MEIKNLSKEKKEELKDIFETITESLDISKEQYDNLIQSYKAVGSFLENDPLFADYKPIVSPQGSLRLGTIIQPVNPKDDLDVDLVFRLSEKNADWTQKDLKDKVGSRLKKSDRYAPMLKNEEGRRCWTLLYRESSENPKEKYHMDILPAVADRKYGERIVKVFSENFSEEAVDQIAIRITDKDSENYAKDTDIEKWLKSNPDGYALWFANRCKEDKSVSLLADAVVPVEKYNKNKTVLQRIVQILKRHRDIMYCNNKDDKPISIIITTLAARAYKGESNIVDGLISVVDNMENHIHKKNNELWISNPVNSDENFADKWVSHPNRKNCFYNWLSVVKKDIFDIVNGKNMVIIQAALEQAFGKSCSTQAAALLAERRKAKIASGNLLLGNSGNVGSVGKMINTTNTFFGN